MKAFSLLGCYAPRVTLIPEQSKLRRNQDISIVSIIELNCQNSLAITTQWLIRNCTISCSDPIQFNQTIDTTFSEIYIPSRAIPYGIYQLQLTVTMTNQAWLKTSASAYVQIISSPSILVNIFPLGTSMVTHGYEQDLRLDPETYSTNSDEKIFNASVSCNRYISSSSFIIIDCCQ